MCISVRLLYTLVSSSDVMAEPDELILKVSSEGREGGGKPQCMLGMDVGL